VRSYRPAAHDAVAVLGQLIRRARIERGWTVRQLAATVGVSHPTVTSIEQGRPTVAIGTVFTAADLLGVRLFGLDAAETAIERRRGEHVLSLLPQHVVTAASSTELDDDF
jgi:transcriptional regulator with XRE-family HTH domain